jgi:hypothetical protein
LPDAETLDCFWAGCQMQKLLTAAKLLATQLKLVYDSWSPP